MQTKQLIGCSAVALLFLVFTSGCITGRGAMSLPGEGLFKQRDTFGSGSSVAPAGRMAESLAPVPKARRVSNPDADPWTPMEKVKNMKDKVASSFKGKDEPEMPKLDGEGPFRKREAQDIPEDFMADLPPVMLTPTDPRERARQLLAEEEAMSITGALDFPEMDEPSSMPSSFDVDFQSLLYDVGTEVFGSRAGAVKGVPDDQLLEFRKNKTGTATTFSASGNQTVDFTWQLTGESLRIGSADRWRLPRNYVLHSFKKSLYLLPTAHVAELKETLREEGEIREEDLSSDFVFDAVQPTFKLVPRVGGLRTAPQSASGLPPLGSLRGSDQKLRAAMEQVDVGSISWKKDSRINDSIFLLTSIWDETAPLDAPVLRLMADKRLAKKSASKPFASRVTMTFAQALQQLAESYGAKVVINEGIVKLAPR